MQVVTELGGSHTPELEPQSTAYAKLDKAKQQQVNQAHLPRQHLK